MYVVTGASIRSQGQEAHDWHEVAHSNLQAVILPVKPHARADMQSLQTRSNALSREYQCQSTIVCQVCHPGRRFGNARLQRLRVLLWSSYELLLQGCTLRFG